MALLFSGAVFSQTVTSSWTDPCTGETKTVTANFSGSGTLVSIYNQQRVFTAQEIISGAFTAWAASAYQAYSSLSPCSQSEAQTQATTQAVQQTAQQAANAATQAAVSAPPPIPTPPPVTTPPPTQTTQPVQTQTSQPVTQNTTSNGTTQNQTSSSGTQSSNQTTSSSGNTSGDGNSSSNNSSGSGGTQENQQQENTSSTENKGTENTSGETTEPTQEDNSTSSQGSEDNTSTESESTEPEASEDESRGEGETDESEGEGENSDESSEDEQNEEEVEEESSEEEQEEEEQEETTEEESEEEEEEKEKKKKQKNTNPPIVVANLSTMESLDKRFNTAFTFGISRSSLRGDKNYGLTSMVWTNFKQYMMMGNFSKIFFSKARPKFVYSASLMGSKMFTTLTGGSNHSIVYLGEKGGVYGLSVGATAIYLNYEIKEGGLLVDQALLSGAVTSFFTKPYNFDRLSVSPMVAVSAPFLNYDMYQRETTYNKDLMIITGANVNYALTKKFFVNLGVNMSHNTNKDIQSLLNFTIGSRFSF